MNENYLTAFKNLNPPSLRSDEGIIIHRKINILEVNQSLLAMFGYEQADLVGMTILDLIEPELRSIVLKYTMIKYDRPYRAVGCRKDGSTFPIEIIDQPVDTPEHSLRRMTIKAGSIPEQSEEIMVAMAVAGRNLEKQLNRTTTELKFANERLKLELDERGQLEEEIRVRARQQAAVAELGQRALAGASLAILSSDAVSSAADILKTPYAAIFELVPNEEKLRLQIGVGWSTELIGQAKVDLSPNNALGFAYHNQAPVIMAEPETETRFSLPRLFREHQLVSGLNIGIQGRERPVGVLGVYSPKYQSFTEDDLHFLQAIANILAMTNDRKQTEAQIELLIALNSGSSASIPDQDSSAAPALSSNGHELIRGERHFGAMGPEYSGLQRSLEQQVADRTQALLYSEERFRRVVTSISDHIYMTEIGQDGRYINRYLSPNIENLTGYPHQRFIADWSFWPSQVIHPDDRPTAAAQADKLARGQNSEVEYRLIRADGRAIWVRDSGRVEKSGKPGNLIVYGVVSDISPRKEVELALARARDEAVAVSRFKSELVARVSHELRTPLGSILGFAEMLQDDFYGPLSETQRQVIENIVESAGYLTGRVNELLDQARLEAGKLELQISAFDPADLVNGVLTKMGILAKNKGLRLTADIDPDLPAAISGDRDRLTQILFNLVGNALKFTERGWIRVRLCAAEGRRWAMAVEDSGPGIPARAHADIFDSFTQLDGSLTRQHAGTGLGLSIVKQLVTIMGGQITVQSEEGVGSTFTVLLPLEAVARGKDHE